MQSMPALIRPGSASSLNTCAVTRAPLACAAAMAAVSTSSDHSGARSPVSRSIQSPTSLTQPSPHRACSATASGSCDSSSSSIAQPRWYRFGRARWPAGTDDARQVVVVVEAAGVDRRSGVAQQQRTDAAFGLGLRDALVEVDAPCVAEADVTMRVDQARARSSHHRRRSRHPPPVRRSRRRRRPTTPPAPHRAMRGHECEAWWRQPNQFLLGNFSFDRSMSARPGGSSSRPFGMLDRSGKPSGMPAPSGLRAFGGVGPRPTLLAPSSCSWQSYAKNPCGRTAFPSGRPSVTSSCGPRRTGRRAG